MNKIFLIVALILVSCAPPNYNATQDQPVEYASQAVEPTQGSHITCWSAGTKAIYIQDVTILSISSATGTINYKNLKTGKTGLLTGGFDCHIRVD